MRTNASSLPSLPTIALLLLLFLAPRIAALEVASPFGDHMVLQRERPVPVWGTAPAGAVVTVDFAGKLITTKVSAGGKWRVDLAPLAAAAQGRQMTITQRGAGQPEAVVRFADVLVGEVWICSGQSNMERQLGPRAGQKPIVNGEAEAAAANFPGLRQLYVTQRTSFAPQDRGAMKWTVCTPQTALDFTAVGFFFARDLHQKLGVPVGIIHSSWGGTPAEAWTSREGLKEFPGFATALSHLDLAAREPETYGRELARQLDAWYARMDAGSGAQPWSAQVVDPAGWETLPVPGAWELAGHDGFDGIVWLRREFDLPAEWKGQEIELQLGAIDDVDTTWVNGAPVGGTHLYSTPRVYRVKGELLKPTGNVIAIRVLDTGGYGGIWNAQLPCEVRAVDGAWAPVSLAGQWQARFSTRMDWNRPPPADVRTGPGVPTVLYNAMIAPLVPYAIRGVTFYQGEANASRPDEYRRLLPALIADWRREWRQGEFPFLFVQIAPFKEMPPEIREAQLLAWQATPNTAMVVTIDCGDAEDIHPADKAPVGRRLALAARALAYGEKVAYSGPVYASGRFEGGRATLEFKHTEGGLVAKDGALGGFTIAGADGVFHPAEAGIEGNTVVVSAAAVAEPKAVRYGWENVAAGNLFNGAGLPASPFRTDGPGK